LTDILPITGITVTGTAKSCCGCTAAPTSIRGAGTALEILMELALLFAEPWEKPGDCFMNGMYPEDRRPYPGALACPLSSTDLTPAAQHPRKILAVEHDVVLVQKPDNLEELIQREDRCFLLTIYPVDLPKWLFAAKQVNQRHDPGIVQLGKVKTIPGVELTTRTNHFLDKDDLTPLFHIKDSMHFEQGMQNKCQIFS